MTESNRTSGYKLPLLETIIAIVLFVFLSVPLIKLYVGADETRSTAVGISEAMIHVENIAELMHSQNNLKTAEGYVFYGSDGSMLSLAEGITKIWFDADWNHTDHKHAVFCVLIDSEVEQGRSGYLIKSVITAVDEDGRTLAELVSAGTIRTE